MVKGKWKGGDQLNIIFECRKGHEKEKMNHPARLEHLWKIIIAHGSTNNQSFLVTFSPTDGATCRIEWKHLYMHIKCAHTKHESNQQLKHLGKMNAQ